MAVNKLIAKSNQQQRIQRSQLPNLLLLSPHLDDAALSCSHRLRSGVIGLVLTIYAGTPSTSSELSEWDRLTRATSPIQRALARQTEDALAWKSINQPYEHLGFLEEDRAIVKKDIVSPLLSMVSSFDGLLVPAGIGNHPHHILVRDAALAVRQPSQKFILYGELPYAAFYGWPQQKSPYSPDIVQYWNNTITSFPLNQNKWKKQLTQLSESEIIWKKKLLSYYKTQMPAVSAGSLDLFNATDILKYELEYEIMD